jgi:hypothetical protein
VSVDPNQIEIVDEKVDTVCPSPVYHHGPSSSHDPLLVVCQVVSPSFPLHFTKVSFSHIVSVRGLYVPVCLGKSQFTSTASDG